jgi:hypothetical protein
MHNVKEELIRSVFGTAEAYRVQVVSDPQIRKAIELLPQAAAMLENSRRAQLER